MNYYLEFKRIYEELLNRKNLLTEELSQLPDGEFLAYKSHGNTCYAERFPAKGNAKKERRVGIKKDRDRLYKLVRKEYVTKAIGLIDKDLKAIETLLRWYKPVDENSVMEPFVEKHPELAEGIYYGPMSHQKWAEMFKPENEFHVENLKSTAADGTKRRSLGELVIGARLDFYGIPYRYEDVTGIPDLSYAPDFKIRRPRDGKIIYWEHLGKVTDDAYMQYNRHKLEDYERYGIVPWDNLIISYSQADGGVNEKLIDGLIQGWLL